MPTQDTRFTETPLRPGPRVVLLGVGTAGGTILGSICTTKDPGVSHTIIDVHLPYRWYQELGIPSFLLGTTVTTSRRERIWVDRAFEADAPRLLELADGAEIVVMTSGLGGRTASLVIVSLSRLFREAGSEVVTVVSSPFVFEGKSRSTPAEASLEALAEIASVCVNVPLTPITDLPIDRLTVSQAYRIADVLMGTVVLSVIEVCLATDPLRLAEGCRTRFEAPVVMNGREDRAGDSWQIQEDWTMPTLSAVLGPETDR